MSDISGSMRESVIKAVETPLGFLALTSLIAEAIIASTVVAVPDEDRLVVVIISTIIIVLGIFFVAFISYSKPEALYGKRQTEYLDLCETLSRDLVDGLRASVSQELLYQAVTDMAAEIERQPSRIEDFTRFRTTLVVLLRAKAGYIEEGQTPDLAPVET